MVNITSKYLIILARKPVYTAYAVQYPANITLKGLDDINEKVSNRFRYLLLYCSTNFSI